jgi:glycosyltransferase involved in cell wall biosynthesis
MIKDRKLKVLLVIPLFNHGDALVSVVHAALATGLQVLVVDDGSTDGGAQKIEGLPCKSLNFPVNRGKGLAILAGAQEAKRLGFDAIVTLDADGQHNPAEANLLINEAESGRWPAIIIGSRQMVQETVPGASRFGRDFSNFWVRLECGFELSDTQSGMRLYPVNELLSLKLIRSRYDFEIEALVKSAWSGVDIRSISVSVHYPPADERISHFHKLKDNWRLTKLHTALVIRRLVPWPHHRLVEHEKSSQKRLEIKNPWLTLKSLCGEHASPFWLATAVWLGLFMGALPLIACHTVAIIYIAYRFHLNKIAAVAASQFCAPPIVPVLCIEAGHFLRTRELILDLSWETWLLEIHYRLWDWFLGSLVIGPFLGLLGGGVMYWGASKVAATRKASQISET